MSILPRFAFYKLSLLFLAAVMLIVAGVAQTRLNRQRTDPALGIIRTTGLSSNAPPALAFTTVALGAFRGIIANILWIRANELQVEGKYFEMAQLANWITDLEPHFTQVWLVQAWNMAYNISVKFTDPADRWRWVQNGIELLRDRGLRYNPTDALMYRELAWFFQHKMGQNLDDAHIFYKLSWATNMSEVLGPGRPNFQQLIHPETEETRRRAKILREQYKMDPAIMAEIDQRYGPLEWRLPEPHAIYWAVVGLKTSKKKELLALRRVIYQSMHQVVLQGRLVYYASNAPPVIAPNLEIVDRANEAYEEMMRDDAEQRSAIEAGHKNFLREVIYLLYTHNRVSSAQKYLDLIRERYPGTIPPELSLAEYALQVLGANIESLTRNQTQTVIEGYLRQSYLSRILEQDDRAAGFYLMARQLYDYYAARIVGQEKRLGFTESLEAMSQRVLNALLDPQTGLAPSAAARLRAIMKIPPPSLAPPPKRE